MRTGAGQRSLYTLYRRAFGKRWDKATHDREKARVARQIASGQLKAENGLTTREAMKEMAAEKQGQG